MDTLLKQYLASARYAQLATSTNNLPWVCTVYIASDDKFNIYWLSYPERRHSREIAANQYVAMAISIKTDQPVVGIQIEGTASIVNDVQTIKAIMKQYSAQHEGAGRDFYKNFMLGRNHHQLYKLTPTIINLFDEVNYPGGTSQITKFKS